MSRWFRHYVGMCRDPKFLGVAASTGQPLERVVYVAAWLLEDASDRDEAGACSGDAGQIAYMLRCDPADVSKVLDGLNAVGFTKDGVIAAWSKRQFESDSSTERSRRHREKKRHESVPETDCNGDATLQGRHATPPETETETERNPNGGSDDPPPADIAPPTEEERFWKKLLPAAQDQGVAKSMVMKLIHTLGDFEEINRILEKTIAAKKPKSYLGGVLRSLARDAEASQPQAPPAASRVPNLPAWIIDARTAGQHVIRHENGRHWRSGGYVYDDLGEVVGW